MHRVARLLVVLGSCLCCIAFQKVSYSQASNTWSSAGQMTQARTGAAAVLLQSGQILITGGTDANGVPMSSAEFFNPATGAFSTAPAMNVPRANHAAIVLASGDVLVTGGVTDAGGDYSSTAEIFSASAQQWTQLQATLGTGLAGHAMALLSDGNVLIAGGTGTAGPVSSLLLFNTADNSITSIGSLQTARTNAAAAATPDGRVLIAGGTDINGNVLASTEIFVYTPSTLSGTVSAGPNLSYARTAATATSTYDGVALIGGYNIQNGTQTDLGNAEILSQWTNAFRVVTGATPRSGHFAVLLPNNGGILATGGTGGQAVDILQPWANSTAGAFFAASSSLSNHAGGFAAPASLGSLLTAGGQGTAANAAELYWFPTISTDQPDYAPGTQVLMTGTGFQPGETVDLHLHVWVNQTTTDLPDYTVTADPTTGAFTFNGYAPNTTDIGARYHLTAVGESSGLQAQAIFTDASPFALTIQVNPAGGSPNANSVKAGTTNGGSDIIGPCTSSAGCSGSESTNNVNLYITATNGTGYAFSSWNFASGSIPTSCDSNPSPNVCVIKSSNNKSATVTANFTATASKLAFTSTAVSVTAGSCSSAITVQAQNASGAGTNPTSTETIALGSTSGNGKFYSDSTCTSQITANPTIGTTGNNFVTFYYEDTTAGSPTITASGTGAFTSAPTQVETVNPGTASKLAFNVQPTTTTAGNAISPAVTVKVEDTYGNVVTGDSSNVTIAISTGGAFKSGSILTVAASSGIATFSNLMPTATGTFTLSAADGSLTGATSNSFTVNAGTAAKLAFSQQPTTTTAGNAISAAVTVDVEDAYGNLVTTDSSSVSIGISTGGVFSGSSTLTVAASSGVAAFSNLVPTASGSFTLSASDGALAGTTSNAFTVNAGMLASITLSPASASITAGGSQAYTATGYDQYSNKIGDVTGSTTFSITNGSCTGASCGSTVAGAQTVTGNDGGIKGTATLTVNPGTITHLVLSPTPATITAGGTQAYTAAGYDMYGNLAGDVTGSTTFGISPDGSCAGANCGSEIAGSHTVTGTYTNNAQGVATLTVNPGNATQLQLLIPGETAAPGTTTGKTGTPNTEYVNGQFAVTVNAVDQYWNVVNTVTDTVQITSNDTQAMLPTAAALTAGTGTFNVTLETVSNPPSPTTTLTATDTTPSASITADTSPVIPVIVVYTAAIAPADWATGQQGSYTLTVSNAAAPNTNNLESVEVAVPAADQDSILNVAVAAAQHGGTLANWTYDNSMLPGILRFHANTAGDAVTPGGAITITFNATSTATVTSSPVPEVWNTTAYSDIASSIALPLAPPEPTVQLGAAPQITSADHTTNEFTYGTAGSFTVNYTGVPTPTVSQSGAPSWITFTDNKNGTATISGTPTAAGSFSFTITAHNGYGNDAMQNFTLKVQQAPLTITASNESKYYGATYTPDGTKEFSITSGTLYNGDMIGSVTLNSDGYAATATVTSPGPTYNITPSAAVFSSGSAGNYNITYDTGTLTVQQAPLTITASNESKYYGATYTPDGTKEFSVTSGTLYNGDKVGSVTLNSDGYAATATVASPGPTYTITPSTAVFSSGSAGNYHITYDTGTLTVNPAPTASTVTANPNPSVYGQSVTFTAFVTNTATPAVPTGTVSFTIDGGTPAAGTLETCPSAIPANRLCATYTTSAISAGASPHTVLATYANSDGDFSGSNGSVAQTVTPAPTATTVTSNPNPSVYGQSVTFTAFVTNTATSAVPTGTVSFTIDGGTSAAGTLETCPSAIPANRLCATYTTSAIPAGASPHTVLATYANSDGDFSGSNGSVAQTVTPAPTATTVTSNLNPSVYGQSVTFTAFVTNTATQAVPTGTVSFTIDTNPAVLGTLVPCPSAIPTNRLCARYITSALAVSGSPHSVTATYTNSDGNFQGSNGALTGGQAITPAPTMVSNVIVTPGTQQYSDLITLSATVGSMPAIGGTLFFYINYNAVSPSTCPSYLLGSTSVTGNSTGTVSNVALLEPSSNCGAVAPGNHTITAVFAPSDLTDFTGSWNSGPLTIKQEDAEITYTGLQYFGASSTASSTSVTLTYTLQDATAAGSGYSFYDPNPGDITKAVVTLTLAPVGSGPSYTCSNLNVVPVAGEPGTGTVTCTLSSVPVPGAYTLAAAPGAGSYYQFLGDTSISITTANGGTGFITGGGFQTATYLATLNTAIGKYPTAGLLTPAPGTKVNFGFETKYNKSGANLQGGANIIVRSSCVQGITGYTPVPGDDGLCVYQIKSNSISSLSENLTAPASPNSAVFTAKANIQDVTRPTPISVAGNVTLQLSMYDVADPGANHDTLAYQISDATNGLWISNNWTGVKTVINTSAPQIQGGNLQVH
ncbi:MAG TPA: Ig-like domain repeat protein [Terracidiphilus sp.]|nr:Ig-like domain repeat protein [Terracidiphilus sp.]